MENKDPYRILTTLANIEHVGTSDLISFKLFQMVDNPITRLEEIMQLIMTDPTVTAQLLRVANSAYYFRSHSVNTVSDAIVLLGMNFVKKVVMAIELIGMYHDNQGQADFDRVQFFKSSFAGAILCNRLALKLGVEDTETPYICGLLRDFGVLALRQYFPDLFYEICATIKRDKAPFSTTCASFACYTQRQITQMLLFRWHIPSLIVKTFQPVTPELMADPVVATNKNLIACADYLLKQQKYALWNPYEKEDDQPPPGMTFDPEYLAKVVPEVTEEVDELILSLGTT